MDATAGCSSAKTISRHALYSPNRNMSQNKLNDLLDSTWVYLHTTWVYTATLYENASRVLHTT